MDGARKLSRGDWNGHDADKVWPIRRIFILNAYSKMKSVKVALGGMVRMETLTGRIATRVSQLRQKEKV